jgi:transcriptional regulator with XRE-family HTH domain
MDEQASGAAPPMFGELLRRQRRGAGLTQEALAERAGVSARAIADLERGINQAPRRDTLQLLADALGLPPAERAALIAARRSSPVAAARTREQPERGVDVAPLDGAQAPRHDLPAQLTSFIGREREQQQIQALLARQRLLTLTGPGGAFEGMYRRGRT